jgi:hypothetical protein
MTTGMMAPRKAGAAPGQMHWVTLRLARGQGFPQGSMLHGYHVLAPLDAEGRLDVASWRRHRDGCTVVRFWGDAPELFGCLRYHDGSGKGGNWLLADDLLPADEAVWRLGKNVLRSGEYITLIGSRAAPLFRVAQVSNGMPMDLRRGLLQFAASVASRSGSRMRTPSGTTASMF